MSGFAINVTVPEEEREALAALLIEQTGQAIEELDDGTLIAWTETEAAALQLRSTVDARRTAHDAPIIIRELPDTDWTTEWKKGLGPRTIGRIVVTPSWVAVEQKVGEVVVVVDPETAFGSGEHGSTRGALLLLDRAMARHASRQAHQGARVLDLGSGSGILAIAAAKLGAARAMAIEFDAEANVVAERNVERNGVGDRVVVLEGDAGELAQLGAPADIVLSNILRNVNVLLLPAIKGAMSSRGIAIFAGMEDTETVLFKPELDQAGLVVIDEVKDAGWWSCAVRIK
jgi:ribosomal protein L11 methyltransferase